MRKDAPDLQFHTMSTFGDPKGIYRANSCVPGSWPDAAANVIASEDPADYFMARNYIIGELNLRPQW